MSQETYFKEISACCRQLRLSANLAERSQETEGASNQEYLFRLLSDEITYRREQRTAKLTRAAGFPRPYSFSQFRADEVEFQSGSTLDSLKSLEFLERNENIIMYGRTGTGKTMLSICIGLRLCEEGIPVRFFRTASLITQLSENKTGGTLTKFLKKLDKAGVLILDEFGYVPYDRAGAELLFDYLSEIHERKPVILNTNLEFSRWVNVLYDEQMTSALIGRLTHHCGLILFPGGNNRLKESTLNEKYREIGAKGQKEGTKNA